MVKVKIVHIDKNGTPQNSNGFELQFNPEQLSIQEACFQSHEKKYRDRSRQKNASSTHLPQENNMVQLSAKLFFNTLTSLNQSEYKDVRKAIRQFYEFTQNQGGDMKQIGFIYGSITLIGVLTAMNVTYTCFDSEGKALRADVDITIQGQYYGEEEKEVLLDQQMPHTDTTSFIDSLIAYGSASDWKNQATLQGIEEPIK